MSVQFTVLASGSAGNAAFLQVEDFGLLIDMGIGPRFLGSRLATIGASWKKVNAVLLTHTHGDHWKDRNLAQLRALRIPLYCHLEHQLILKQFGASFDPLYKAELVRSFQDQQAFALGPLHITPIEVPHDSRPTFAFRIDGQAHLFGPTWSLGYASDLGKTPKELEDHFRDVHVLALEFNHDEGLERRSARPRYLINRVLSDLGHLSNRQASAFVESLLSHTEEPALRHLFLLHRSLDCNLPNLAKEAALSALKKFNSQAEIILASQDCPTRSISLDYLQKNRQVG